MNKPQVCATLVFGVALSLSGCVAGPDAHESGAPESVGETDQALIAGYWTSYTSEEYAPLSCNNGYFVDGLACTGGYCDNVALHCASVGRNIRNISWTSYFSEEGTNYRYCPSNQFMVGLACRGGNCDDLSIQCASFDNTTRGSCYWTPFFSEEQAYLYLYSGYFAAGAKCSGSNCDNISIYQCSYY